MHNTPNTAKEQLDARVREIIAWHFSHETGSPFWLDWAKKTFDPKPDERRHWYESGVVTESSMSHPFESDFQRVGSAQHQRASSCHRNGQSSGIGKPPRDDDHHGGSGDDDHHGEDRPQDNRSVASIDKLTEIVRALTALAKEIHELGETILFRFGPQVILAITIYYIAVAKFKHPDDQSGYPKGVPIPVNESTSERQLSDVARH